MRPRVLWLAGTLACLLGIVTLVPARFVYHVAAPPELSLAGISGTVWSGRAEHASVAGVYLRGLEWQTRPLSLLSGKLAADVSAEPVAGFIEGRFSVAAGGKLGISQLTASLGLASLAGALQMGGIDGSANLQVERLELVDGLPTTAVGSVEVANLLVPDIHRQSRLGGYRAEFFTEDAGVTASVEDTDGIFDVAGRFDIGADRSYRFIARLSAKANADESLKRQLRFLGTPDSNGQYELRLEGQL